MNRGETNRDRIGDLIQFRIRSTQDIVSAHEFSHKRHVKKLRRIASIACRGMAISGGPAPGDRTANLTPEAPLAYIAAPARVGKARRHPIGSFESLAPCHAAANSLASVR